MAAKGGRGAGLPLRGRRKFLAQMPDDHEDDAPAPRAARGKGDAPSTGTKSWSVSEVGDWLATLGLGEYKAKFATHHISGAVLPLLSKDVLKSELGIPSLG